MNRNGFTLIEVLIVVGITGILLAIGTMNFRDMMVKNGIEKEMKEMYADLMTIRAEALFQKKIRSVKVSPTTFSVYSSNVVTVTPLSSKTLKYAVNVFPTSPASLQIDFDGRGVATFNGDSTIPNAAVCTQTSSSNIDTLAASPTILQMGRQKSAGCSYANTAIQ